MNTSQTPDHAAHGEGGLKIIGAGFGRTGTLSLKVALEDLGFGPCYHMSEVFQHPDHAKEWLAGYQATVDWPGCSFYAELMEVYPDAKVILTVRDPEKWHESVVNSIYQGPQFNWLARTLFSVVGFISPSWRTMRKMQKALVWEGTFHGHTSEKEYAISECGNSVRLQVIDDSNLVTRLEQCRAFRSLLTPFDLHGSIKNLTQGFLFNWLSGTSGSPLCWRD